MLKKKPTPKVVVFYRRKIYSELCAFHYNGKPVHMIKYLGAINTFLLSFML